MNDSSYHKTRLVNRLTVSTGQPARRTTCSARLPRIRRCSPRRPCVPMMMASAFHLAACSNITSIGIPTTQAPSAVTPLATNLDSTRLSLRARKASNPTLVCSSDSLPHSDGFHHMQHQQGRLKPLCEPEGVPNGSMGGGREVRGDE